MSDYTEDSICYELDLPKGFFNLLRDDYSDGEIIEINLPIPGTPPIKCVDPAILYMHDKTSDVMTIFKIGEYSKLAPLAEITSQRLLEIDSPVTFDIANALKIIPISKNHMLISNIFTYKNYLSFYIKAFNSILRLSMSILNKPIPIPYFGYGYVA